MIDVRNACAHGTIAACYVSGYSKALALLVTKSNKINRIVCMCTQELLGTVRSNFKGNKLI